MKIIPGLSANGGLIFTLVGGAALVGIYYYLSNGFTKSPVGVLTSLGRGFGVIQPYVPGAPAMPATGPVSTAKYLPDSTQPVRPATPVKSSAYADWFSGYAGVPADQNRLLVA